MIHSGSLDSRIINWHKSSGCWGRSHNLRHLLYRRWTSEGTRLKIRVSYLKQYARQVLDFHQIKVNGIKYVVERTGYNWEANVGC